VELGLAKTLHPAAITYLPDGAETLELCELVLAERVVLGPGEATGMDKGKVDLAVG
jgi:hypothetical protein